MNKEIKVLNRVGALKKLFQTHLKSTIKVNHCGSSGFYSKVERIVNNANRWICYATSIDEEQILYASSAARVESFASHFQQQTDYLVRNPT